MDDWAEIAEVARFAPTPHNTQPFRVRRVDATHAEILLASERLLPEEDHQNLYMASAFGIFAETVERAGRAIGRRVVVEADRGVEPPTWRKGAGLVRLGAAELRGAIEPEPGEKALVCATRRTSRLPFDGRAVAPEMLARFGAVAARAGHRFTVESRPGAIEEILALNARAIVENLNTPNERRELAGWYRVGATPTYGDGLWNVPLAQPGWEVKLAFGAPWLLRAPPVRDFATQRYLATQAGTPHIGFLDGPFRAWPELVRAGRALMNVWLSMAAEGVSIHPLGSMLTNATYAERVARHVGSDDVWLLFRLGYSPPAPRAPRLKTVLL
jgi:nitroreductase